MLSIKQAAQISGLSECYIRRSILNGTLPSEKTEIARNTFRHDIDEETFESWRKTRNHSKRDDNRARMLLYTTPDELEKIRQFMADNNIGILSKPKQYVKSKK
jgi:hypothetical protein